MTVPEISFLITSASPDTLEDLSLSSLLYAINRNNVLGQVLTNMTSHPILGLIPVTQVKFDEA